MIEDHRPIEHNFDLRSLEGDLVAVPLFRPVDLLAGCEGAVESSGEFGLRGLGVVAIICHLELQTVEGWVSRGRGPQGATTVTLGPELELELQFEVGVIHLTDQPGPPGSASVQDSLFYHPLGAFWAGL